MSKNASISSVQVAIRVRPLLAFEYGNTKCVEVLTQLNSHSSCPNIVRIGGETGPTFCFDQAFDGSTPQQKLYDERLVPLVKSCLEGYNATTFAYGQTGSGKTFTMTGPTTTMQDGDNAGVIPRSIESIFDQLNIFRETRTTKESKYEYEVRLQFLELYGEEIRDLLTPSSKSKSKIAIRDIGLDEPEVLGATQRKVDSSQEALVCLASGMLRRVTGSTAMNASSSRSHAILSVMVEQTTTAPNGHASVLRSKFNFVDLAGSERQKRTQAEGKRLKEGIDINKGLLVLGNVISALGDARKVGKTFVPYRDSKLTRLLKGSLGGNHKTLMIACVSPSSSNLEESLNCLRYANRAKNIQNNAIVNVDANTKLISELNGHIVSLATELLQIKEACTEGKVDANTATIRIMDSKFSVELLHELIKGCTSPSSTPGTNASFNKTENSSSMLNHTLKISKMAQEEKSHLSKSFFNTTDKHFNNTAKDLQTLKEEIFTLRAENELYRVQIDNKSTTEVEGAFLEKAISYEREIKTLKEALSASNYPPPFRNNLERSDFLTKVTTQSLQQDRAELEELQLELGEIETLGPEKRQDSVVTPSTKQHNLDSHEMDVLRSQVLLSIPTSVQLEAEEQAADAELHASKQEFLNSEDEDEATSTFFRHERENVHEKTNTKIEDNHRYRQVQFNLTKLSRSIDEKEALVQELRLSQKKYASMRDFYEDKLRQMEDQVRLREAEREALFFEVQTSKRDAGPRTQELEQKLSDKERHISGLKKRQDEILKLTRISSRNEEEIIRLKDDIAHMKRKKVEMQKLANNERKTHFEELNRLKKEVRQRDREVTKLKRISDKKTVQAEKANQVAKSRLEQIGILKAKYTEAERNLRVKTVKKGVMEKAGLDSVIVGRRNAVGKKVASKKSSLSHSSKNIDLIRDFLDKRVSNVGKKEAIADKLANEWEDHLVLVAKKQQLMDKNLSKESMNSIEIQLVHKEERIRKLAQRLGRQKDHEGVSKDTEFLGIDDAEFKRLLPEAATVAGAKLTSRILFGMVVRERRRVASLARTAASLNEKTKLAEREVKEKEAAFISYQEEERAERALLAQSHQEQILSLMAIVKEEESASKLAKTSEGFPLDSRLASPLTNRNFKTKIPTPTLTVLANERIAVLENQLQEEREKVDELKGYKTLEEETKRDQEQKSKECENLREVAENLKSSLCKIRDLITKEKSHEESGFSKTNQTSYIIGNIVESALHSEGISYKRLSFPMYEEDEGEDQDEEIPEWANDIMADLAVIAEGHVPEALLNCPAFMDVVGESSSRNREKGRKDSKTDTNSSVFDRLTNPNNFTGTQKQKQTFNRQQKESFSQENRKASGQKAVKKLDHILKSHDEKNSRSRPPKKARGIKSDTSESRSVFERLMSPSNYTGTQKEKLQGSLSRKKRQDQDFDEVGGEENVTNQNISDRLQRAKIKAQTMRQGTDGKRPQIPNNGNEPSVPSQAHITKHISSQGGDKDTISQSPNSSRKTEIRSHGGVFKRLQNTTTQSFALKHLPE